MTYNGWRGTTEDWVTGFQQRNPDLIVHKFDTPKESPVFVPKSEIIEIPLEAGETPVSTYDYINHTWSLRLSPETLTALGDALLAKGLQEVEEPKIVVTVNDADLHPIPVAEFNYRDDQLYTEVTLKGDALQLIREHLEVDREPVSYNDVALKDVVTEAVLRLDDVIDELCELRHESMDQFNNTVYTDLDKTIDNLDAIHELLKSVEITD